jgi:hypothetical protein
MSCDFSALANLDLTDPDLATQLLQECTRTLTDPVLWFWAIAFTVVGAVVGWWIGKRNNAVARDTLLGAALGPIGWIVSWYLPAPKPKPKPACPACKREVDAGDAHCRHCGVKLGPVR